jgi:hypothetical protein
MNDAFTGFLFNAISNYKLSAGLVFAASSAALICLALKNA